MLKETEMKLLVWDLYNPPLQAPLPHTWHPVRWAGVVWKEGQQNFLFVYPCPVSLSPPPLTPQGSFFSKSATCHVQKTFGARETTNNQIVTQPTYGGTGSGTRTERYWLKASALTPSSPLLPKVSTKMKQSLAKERYAHLLRERNSTDHLEGLFVSYEIFES